MKDEEFGGERAGVLRSARMHVTGIPRQERSRSLNLHDRRAEPPLIRSGRVARVGRTEWSQALTYPQTWSLRSNIGTASEHAGLPSLP